VFAGEDNIFITDFNRSSLDMLPLGIQVSLARPKIDEEHLGLLEDTLVEHVVVSSKGIPPPHQLGLFEFLQYLIVVKPIQIKNFRVYSKQNVIEFKVEVDVACGMEFLHHLDQLDTEL
jgi:hypothetical protein